MKILYGLRLSARIFKNNKIKNSIVILAIAIAFSFVGIYFVFVDALNAFFLQSNLRQMGTEAEAEYRNVTYEEYLQFKKENRTLHCSYGTRLEQWTVGEYNSRQVVLNYMEEEAAGLCFAELTEGTWPETENEVAIDKNYGRYIEEIPIGSEIVISGVRYVVSGICNSNSKAEYASIYLSGQAFAKYKTAAAGIVYVDAEKEEAAVRDIVHNSPEAVSYVSYEMVRQEEKNGLRILETIGGGISLAAGIMAFLNFFHNAVANRIERKAEYDVLRKIGMTKRQLTHLVRAENGILFGIAAVIGCVVGGIISIILLWT